MGIEVALKRDRLIVLGGIAGLSALAWAYMIHEARAMSFTGACCIAGMKMAGPDMSQWSPAALIPLFLMWAEMMVAMMLPSASPMILTFAMLNRKRQSPSAKNSSADALSLPGSASRQPGTVGTCSPFVPTTIFVTGYLAVWTGFSAIAAIAQWALHATALLSPAMVSTSPLLGGMLLMAAGVFQWTPIKNTCLANCRSPLTFLMNDWREGKGGAFRMGLKHGAYCAGCCWFLMALLFVAGVMNMWWVALIAILVLVEKVSPKGLWIGRMAGLLLAAWGVGMMAAR